MIDAGPSLEAAAKISGRSMAEYLLAHGWTGRGSKLDKFLILFWPEERSSWLVQLVLPIWPGVADALRAVAAVERRDVFSVARDVEHFEKGDQPVAVMGGFADGD